MTVNNAYAYVSSDPANRLGLDYREQATRLPWQRRGIVDCHTHLHSVEAAKMYFQAAACFGVTQAWTMAPLNLADDLLRAFPGQLELIAVPDYSKRDLPETFTTQWLKDIEGFAQRGCRVCKFWSAPRGRDLTQALRLDSPVRTQGMKLAQSLGMIFMVHVADPDTWFATKYKDAAKYGLKSEHYQALERRLEEFHDVPWIGAHMAGHPEDLDHLARLLERYPHLYLDCSATKWQVRELSKHPRKFKTFAESFRGRILFGTDIVANPDNIDFNLYASRFWALRTLIETDYEGPSPIVDPDLNLVDPSVAPDATATLRGAWIDASALPAIYHENAAKLLSSSPLAA